MARVRIEENGPVRTVTLTRADKRNALDNQMLDELEAAFNVTPPNTERLTVIRAEGRESAVVVGHDWGAGIAWQVAMRAPEVVERLVILSVPHPAGFGRELATNESQQEDSQYARDFQRPESHESLTAEGLAGWVSGPEARARYVEAFERSSFEAMMNYYRASYPSGGGGASGSTGSAAAGTGGGAGTIAASAGTPTLPRIRCPVLVLHGLQDRALHASGHNGTWEHVDAETTIVMFPTAGHFLQHDEPGSASTRRRRGAAR